MKTLKKRFLSFGMALIMALSMLPVFGSGLLTLAEGEEITVYMTISNEGSLLQANDGSPMGWKSVSVADLNNDGKYSFHEALTAAHKTYNTEDGYSAPEGIFGLSVERIWGIDTMAILFYNNDAALETSVGDAYVQAGDYLTAAVLADMEFYSDVYTTFDKKGLVASTGEDISLYLKDEHGLPIEGAELGYYNEAGIYVDLNATTDAEGNAVITFPEGGIYQVSAKGSVPNTAPDYSNWPDVTYTDIMSPLMAPCCTVVISATSFKVTTFETAPDDIATQSGGYSYYHFMSDSMRSTLLFTITVPEGTTEVGFEFSAPVLAYNYDANGMWLDGYYEDYRAGSPYANVKTDADENGIPDFILVQTPFYPDQASAFKESSDVLFAITFRYDTEPVIPDVPLPDALGDVWSIYAATQANVASKMATKEQAVYGNEWLALDLARDQQAVNGYYVEDLVNTIIDKKGVLHTGVGDYTNYAKAVLTLTALGVDASDVNGINLIEKLEDLNSVTAQGINGVIYALIALDCGDYQGTMPREAYYDTIVSAQLPDGGWDYAGKAADPDMTALALQALAPYYSKSNAVQAAIERGLQTLSALQQEDGGFLTEDAAYAESSESTAMVILALTELGIDPAKDPRFVKNGKSAIDNLCSFAVEGGGFRHVKDGGYNDFATEQGYRALVSYVRFLTSTETFYRMDSMKDMLKAVHGKLTDKIFAEPMPAGYIADAEGLILAAPEVKAISGKINSMYEISCAVVDENNQFFALISETAGKEEVTVTIPQDKLAALGEKVLIAGVHNGKVLTIEPASVDRKSGVVKFFADKFSPYAVVSGTQSKTSPKTGEADSALLIILGLIALAGCTAGIVIRKRTVRR